MIVKRTEAGQSWVDLAELDPLASVLDPADRRGGKNRLIDRVHKRALSLAVGDVQGSAVLDFGCGTGRLSDWFARNGAHVEGVDVTPEMVAVAQARVPQARFQTIDGLTLPFEEGQFDLVVTAYVLQYYVGDDGAIPIELGRVLRGGGRLIAIEQVTESDIGRGGSVAAYERMLRDAGFDMVEASMVRVSHSRLTALAQRRPSLSRLPGIPRLVLREARRSPTVPLTDGRYADALFQASKDGAPRHASRPRLG
jgi:SAM-dependent methyltransferase